jgi:hypothetical protein
MTYTQKRAVFERAICAAVTTWFSIKIAGVPPTASMPAKVLMLSETILAPLWLLGDFFFGKHFAHLIQTVRCYKTPRRLVKGGNAASERYRFSSMGISEKGRKCKKAEADGDDTATLGPRADARSPTLASANTNPIVFRSSS